MSQLSDYFQLGVAILTKNGVTIGSIGIQFLLIHNYFKIHSNALNVPIVNTIILKFNECI